jgi:hypothetical protein
VSKPEGGKTLLNENEAAVIDLVRGPMKRTAWIRETALNVVYGIEELGPPLADTSSPGQRDIQCALDLTPEQRAAVDSVRGGVGLGTWVRDTALRQAMVKLAGRT